MGVFASIGFSSFTIVFAGQAYVALSRVTSMRGLQVLGLKRTSVSLPNIHRCPSSHRSLCSADIDHEDYH